MRAINIFLLLFFFVSAGCTTIQVAEVVTKTSIKVAEGVTETTNKIIGKEDSDKKSEKKDKLFKEKEEIVDEKKKERAVSNKQKKITKIKIIGKTSEELVLNFGKPSLIRKDGKTQTMRFDRQACKLFVYFNLSNNISRSEYYEIRNTNGQLIEKKESIDKCFLEMKKI